MSDQNPITLTETQKQSLFLFLKIFAALDEFNNRVKPFFNVPSFKFHFVAKAFARTNKRDIQQGFIPYVLGVM